MSYEVKTLHLINGLSDDYLQKEIIERSKDNRIAYMTEDIVLNTECVKQLAKILEKQQKEIEKLNKYALEDLKDLNNYIPKHKIRGKIKELENKRDEEILSITSALFQRDINVLQELLGDEK